MSKIRLFYLICLALLLQSSIFPPSSVVSARYQYQYHDTTAMLVWSLPEEVNEMKDFHIDWRWFSPSDSTMRLLRPSLNSICVVQTRDQFGSRKTLPN